MYSHKVLTNEVHTHLIMLEITKTVGIKNTYAEKFAMDVVLFVNRCIHVKYILYKYVLGQLFQW